MTVYGQILYIQKTLDKRKHCTRELVLVVRTDICHKKTLKAVFRAVKFYCCSKKRTFVKVPLRLGLKTFEKGRLSCLMCNIFCGFLIFSCALS